MEGGDRTVHVNAEAGCNWDDFVAFTVQLGLEGVEGLSGIPGTVGASVVQNIGAYGPGGRRVRGIGGGLGPPGQAHHRSDRPGPEVRIPFVGAQIQHVCGAGHPGREFFPTPRYVVLSVTFALRHSATGTVGYGPARQGARR